MKALITLIFTISSFFSLAQSIKFNIQGTIKNTEHAKFAYLSTLSLQVPVSSDKIFMITPIKDGKFEFNGTFDLEGKDYQEACVFVDERSNISKEELESKFKQLIWITGRENNLRRLILEDIKFDVEERDQMKVSKIIEGGMLTRQLDMESKAVRAGNRKLQEFVKTYPDSPISLKAVETVTNLTVPSNKDRMESIYGTPLELYNLLSERLKKSKRGIDLKKDIVKKYKP